MAAKEIRIFNLNFVLVFFLLHESLLFLFARDLVAMSVMIGTHCPDLGIRGPIRFAF
jgi:hypothetical protein